MSCSILYNNVQVVAWEGGRSLGSSGLEGGRDLSRSLCKLGHAWEVGMGVYHGCCLAVQNLGEQTSWQMEGCRQQAWLEGEGEGLL